MQWCSEWAIFWTQITHRSRTSGAGRSDKNPSFPFLATKGTWNSVFFLADDFLQKDGRIPKERAKLHHLQGVLGNFQRPGNWTFVVDLWIIPWLWGMIWKHGQRFFCPRDALGKLDVHMLTSFDTLKMILARTSKDGSIPSFHPVRRRVWCLAKRRITSFFRLKVLVRFLSGAPTVFTKDGSKGYLDGKAKKL